MKPQIVTLAFLLALGAAQSGAQSNSGTLIDRVKGNIDATTIQGLLVDNAAGAVSAASLAGVDADALSVVENVRDFSLLVSAFDKESKGFGLSVTPARTTAPFPAINLFEYAQPGAHHLRLLGALTFGYAQGKLTQSGVDYTRRAVSAATSAYFRPGDDPVVVVAKAKQCTDAAFDKLSDRPSITQVEADRLVALARLERDAAQKDARALSEIEAIRLKAARGNPQAQAELEVIEQATLAREEQAGDKSAALERKKRLIGNNRVDAESEKAALESFNTCADEVLKKHAEKWNRSRYSVSYATGSIKQADGGGVRASLGHTIAANVLYGFDGIAALSERAAITVVARYSRDEPVLDTLGSAITTFKNSTLVAVRLAGGSSTFRGLAETSNARSSDVTATQRTFKRALGIDYRVINGLWLNLRYGKQRKVDGSGDETGSFLVLNYSPSATLGR